MKISRSAHTPTAELGRRFLERAAPSPSRFLTSHFFSRNKIFLTSHERAPREQRTHAGDDASHLEPSQARPNFLIGPVPFLFPWGRRLRPKKPSRSVLGSVSVSTGGAARRHAEAGSCNCSLAVAERAGLVASAGCLGFPSGTRLSVNDRDYDSVIIQVAVSPIVRK